MTAHGRAAALVVGLSLVAPGCTSRIWRARFVSPEAEGVPPASSESPFLKAHLKDGGLLVLDRWEVDSAARRLSGSGRRFDAGRARTGEGALEVGLDQVALIETNRPEQVPRAPVAAMAVFTGVSLAGSALCLADPKACFGSCPTFYLAGAVSGRPVAEGFSAAVARPFEETDVDALGPAPADAETIDLVMLNEALETHYLRRLRVLAAPRSPGTRVYRAGDRFLEVATEHAPLRCRGAAGDCLGAVREADGVEYQSPAGELDLAEQETVEVSFPRPAGPAGLVVLGRNSLLNTFVFYQVLAWLGTHAGEVFARLEELPPGQVPSFAELERIVARGEVEVLSHGGWAHAGAFAEVGPIAPETHLVPLPRELPPGEVRLRIRLTRGAWKLDRLALAELRHPVTPLAVELAEVRRGEALDAAALSSLRGHGPRLTSLPGDQWTLRFALPPEAQGAELFLESRGYYLEWMRRQWLADEDLDAAMAFLDDPRPALRRLAPEWKRLEPDAERIFWASRLAAGSLRGRP
ncbi:MAG TPA: hypothetical protein VFI16_03860 [Anaeromyxobacteraceae bacterium]|nr:hypothetical protein [Anaeromyxobacteraceae bacterium]